MRIESEGSYPNLHIHIFFDEDWTDKWNYKKGNYNRTYYFKIDINLINKYYGRN